MSDEHIETTLYLNNGREGENSRTSETVLLTNSRVIRLKTSGLTRDIAFISLTDVETVEITDESKGYGGFIWGGLAFVVSLMAWQIWDHPVGSPLGAIVIAAMGIYLVVDHVISPKITIVTIKSGSSQIRFGIDEHRITEKIHNFVNRLFELKILVTTDTIRIGKKFALH